MLSQHILSYIQVSPGVLVGTNLGMLYSSSENCGSDCPESCTFWMVAKNGRYVDDKTLSIQCQGRQIQPQITTFLSTQNNIYHLHFQLNIFYIFHLVPATNSPPKMSTIAENSETISNAGKILRCHSSQIIFLKKLCS